MLRVLCQHLALRAESASPLLTSRMTSTSTSTNQKLAGKVAIVTASTDGIGFAIAKRLCQDGAKVMISSRKQQNVDSALQQLKGENLHALGVVCHVGKQEDRTKLIEETVKQYGGVDILVSNAAVSPFFGPLLSTPEDAWDKIFEINVKSAFMLCKEIVPCFEKRGSGAIVLVSSIAGYSPFSAIGAYSVSKTALLGLTKALAPELASSNVRINGVAPGIIKTKFSKQLWQSKEAEEVTLQQIPLGRLGTGADCAGAVSFLVSDDAEYMTGENVLVTGGMYSRL